MMGHWISIQAEPATISPLTSISTDAGFGVLGGAVLGGIATPQPYYPRYPQDGMEHSPHPQVGLPADKAAGLLAYMAASNPAFRHTSKRVGRLTGLLSSQQTCLPGCR